MPQPATSIEVQYVELVDRLSGGHIGARLEPRPTSSGTPRTVITKVVVHYHVGIRHYTATEPSQIAVCADSAQVNAAMKAAQSAS